MYCSYKIFSKSITDNVVVSYHLYSSNMSTEYHKIMVPANKIILYYRKQTTIETVFY